MKLLILIISFIMAMPVVRGQESDEQNKKVKAAEEIKKLMMTLNEAMLHHDRATLEKIYADEFLFIHGLGYIDNKTVQVNEIMASDSVPLVPVLPFDQFYVFGDIAVLRAIYNRPGTMASIMSTSIYAKKEGSWQILQVQSTQQQVERKTVMVDPKILGSYTGKYVKVNGTYTIVTSENDTLMMQRNGWPKYILSPASVTRFFNKAGSEYTFYTQGNNKVTHFIARFQNGQALRWKKVE